MTFPITIVDNFFDDPDAIDRLIPSAGETGEDMRGTPGDGGTPPIPRIPPAGGTPPTFPAPSAGT